MDFVGYSLIRNTVGTKNVQWFRLPIRMKNQEKLAATVPPTPATMRTSRAVARLFAMRTPLDSKKLYKTQISKWFSRPPNFELDILNCRSLESQLFPNYLFFESHTLKLTSSPLPSPTETRNTHSTQRPSLRKKMIFASPTLTVVTFAWFWCEKLWFQIKIRQIVKFSKSNWHIRFPWPVEAKWGSAEFSGARPRLQRERIRIHILLWMKLDPSQQNQSRV